MKVLLVCFWTDERGQDLLEYALLVGMVAIAVLACLPQVNTMLSTVITKMGSIIQSNIV